MKCEVKSVKLTLAYLEMDICLAMSISEVSASVVSQIGVRNYLVLSRFNRKCRVRIAKVIDFPLQTMSGL